MNQNLLLWGYAVFLLSATFYFIFSPWWAVASLVVGSVGVGILALLSLHKRLKTTTSPGERRLGFDRYLVDITHHDPTPYRENSLIGRKEEFRIAETVLSRPYANSLLVVGAPGSGKSVFLYSLIQALRSRQARMTSRAATSFFVFDMKKVFTEAVGSESEKGHFLRALLDQVAARKSVVIIENAEACRTHWSFEGLSRILCEYANRAHVSILLSLRDQEYRKVAREADLGNAFETLFLRPPSKSEVLEIVSHHFRSLEEKKPLFTPQAREAWLAAVEQLEDGLSAAAYHEKVIQFGEDLILFATQRGKSHIDENDVAAFVRAYHPWEKSYTGQARLAGRENPRASSPFSALTSWADESRQLSKSTHL